MLRNDTRSHHPPKFLPRRISRHPVPFFSEKNSKEGTDSPVRILTTGNMKYNRAMKRFRPLDFLVVLLVLATGIFLCAGTTSRKNAKVFVKAAGTEYEFPAGDDGIREVRGKNGMTKFEIRGGRIRILDSACPNKTCVHQGWASPLVCLPNDVIIQLEGRNEEYDALTN